MQQLREPAICSSHREVWRTSAWFMHDTAKLPGMSAMLGLARPPSLAGQGMHELVFLPNMHRLCAHNSFSEIREDQRSFVI